MNTNISYHKMIMDTIGVPDRAVTEKECKELTGLPRVTRWRLAEKGSFPKPRKVSARTNIWKLSDILAWLDSNPTLQ